MDTSQDSRFLGLDLDDPEVQPKKASTDAADMRWRLELDGLDEATQAQENALLVEAQGNAKPMVKTVEVRFDMRTDKGMVRVKSRSGRLDLTLAVIQPPSSAVRFVLAGDPRKPLILAICDKWGAQIHPVLAGNPSAKLLVDILNQPSLYPDLAVEIVSRR